jgi:hypothetical protein
MDFAIPFTALAVVVTVIAAFGHYRYPKPRTAIANLEKNFVACAQ